MAADLGPGQTPPQVVSEDERRRPRMQILPPVVGQMEPAQAAAPDDEGPPSELPPKLVDFGGIPVLVDRPKGFVQQKLDDAGQLLWERTYLHDYGYLAGTEGGDGEGLDVFLGPTPEAPIAWWVVQTTGHPFDFDEYKLMLGFDSQDAAHSAYLHHVPEKFFGSISPMPVDRLKALLGLPGNPLHTTSLKSAPRIGMRLLRAAKAVTAATSYTGNTLPAEQAPAEVRAIVETAPLTWRYPDPKAVGGWLGGIEPADEQWIAFVAIDGKVLLWASRDETGGVRGEPFLLWRPDLAVRDVELVASTKAATKEEEQFIFGIVLMPEKKDLQREIYAHEVVRATAHDYLAFFRNTDIQHKVFINEAVELVESTIEKVAFWMARDGTAYPADPATGAPILPAESPYRTAPNALRFVPQGTWTVAHRIKDRALWADIKAGKLTGYSINGLKKLAVRPPPPEGPNGPT